ncbi:SH3 domain-binding protein 5-like [Arctopsyche grandis]|uniref:SH3 domain-binding protein 5-like n=1 Tax=Arctopsyche grandis TaxID=121162 RepID=UPI00406D7E8E
MCSYWKNHLTTDSNTPVDPRVQIELERLNTATDDINKLEVDLDEARLVFRQLLFESNFKIQSLAKKLGGCIDKSRPYYEARFKANKALQEMRATAVLFEKANSAHSAAREMVYLAEQGLSGGVPLDPAWQEMLNHATARVNQAEADRASAGARHRITADQHRSALTAARSLQHSLKRHVAKSRFLYCTDYVNGLPRLM